jgi:hypothetical protein
LILAGTHNGFDEHHSAITEPGASRLFDGFGSALASGDFDGDGFADLAVGAPGSGNSNGAVWVFYGSRDGVGVARAQLFRGPPPSPLGWGSEYGAALAVADLDGDGFADLVVGAPEDEPVSEFHGGSVQLLFGSAAGLSADRSRTLGRPHGDDFEFGRLLALGDVDGDGFPDLVEAGSGVATDYDGEGEPGQTAFCRGGPAGPLACRTLGRRVVPGPTSLAIGDLTGDGRAEIVQGVPYEHFLRDDDADPSPSVAGIVRVWPGTPSGPIRRRSIVVTQDSRGVPGTSEQGDRFGQSVTVGRLDRDRFGDIAVGAPGEMPGYGRVTILRGAAHGISQHGTLVYDRRARGLPRSSRRWRGLGATLSLLDHDGDGRLDLTIGMMSEAHRLGALLTLRGTRRGIAAPRPRVFRLAPFAPWARDALVALGRVRSSG